MSEKPKPSDPIGLYDPYMGSVSPTGQHKYVAGGYKIWPENRASVQAATLRIMSIGNSTSLWPSAAWSMELGEMLTTPDRKVAVFNGAGKGNTSSQELLRVLRDAPGIAPNIIVALSGICDIGYLLNTKNNPFMHKYTRRVMDTLRESDLVDDVVYGYPIEASPAAVWCRNQRMARVIADEMGIPIVVFLQAVQGFGRYDQTPQEAEHLAKKGKVVLLAADKPYIDCVQDFYTEVRATIAANPAAYDHVVDFTDVFADCPGAYRDHRHQSPEGVTHLASKMLPIVTEKLWLR